MGGGRWLLLLSWAVLVMASFVHCLPLTAGEESGRAGLWSSPTWMITASVCFALTAALLATLGCLCCRNDSIKLLGGQNGTNVPHLPLGSLGWSGAGGELTLFPPVTNAHLECLSSQPSLDDKVSFDPLPKIFPRTTTSPAKPPTAFRPAHFSGELCGRPSSVHDWFNEPQANFPRQQLQYLQELGTGWFGQAVRGEAQNLCGTGSVGGSSTARVVVKILRSDATPTEHLCFLQEVQPFRVLKHPNILRLLGRCLESDPFLLILEDSSMDLKAFLLGKRVEYGESYHSGSLTLHLATGILSGLEHMHRHNFLHLDLATRNCVLSRDQTVKLGDYGTSIQSYKEDYYLVGEVAVPIRWSAPESLHCTDAALEAKQLTKEANIWSLGVVLWELLSMGLRPYDDLEDEQVLRRVVAERNLVLQMPKVTGAIASRIYQVAAWCWNEVPSERPTAGHLVELMGHLRESQDEFESRWQGLQPEQVREFNLAPGVVQPVLGFESDFVPKASNGGADEALDGEGEEDLTSLRISEAIRDLDAILAAESGPTSTGTGCGDMGAQRHDSLGQESSDSRDLNSLGSLGFRKSASVEDLLREGPEKVAEMFRITVIDDVDASLGEPCSLGSDGIWKTEEDPGGGSGAGLSSEEKLWAKGTAASEKETSGTQSDVSSQVGHVVGGGGAGSGGFLPPPAANSTVTGPPGTNQGSASSGVDANAVPPEFAADGHVLTCSRSNGTEETAMAVSSLASSAEARGGGSSGANSSRDSASYVTALESGVSDEDSSCGVIDGPPVDGSDSEAFFLTVDGDDTSECSEATLADDCGDDGLASAFDPLRSSTPTGTRQLSPVRSSAASWVTAEDAPDSSALSDLTVEEEEQGGPSSSDGSLALAEGDPWVDEMRRIADEAVGQHNATLLDWTSSSKGAGPKEEDGSAEYQLGDISSVLDQEESSWSANKDLVSSGSPISGEEEEIMTVNTLTHEITVRPASHRPLPGVVLDGQEVLAGSEDAGEDEDTDDTSSTGTSCSTTSGSFECLTDEPRSQWTHSEAPEESHEEDQGVDHGEGDNGEIRKAKWATWDRSATPTKSLLKSARGKTSSLRKTVSFNDVISSVYHYTAEEEAPPTPPAPSSLSLDLAGLRDCDFQFFLEEDFPEEATYSSEEEEAVSPRRGMYPSRPTWGTMTTFAPLYCIAGLAHDDLGESPPSQDAGPSPEVVQSESLLADEKPPWDSSASELSGLDGSVDDGTDAESLQSDSPSIAKSEDLDTSIPSLFRRVGSNGHETSAEDINANDLFRDREIAMMHEPNLSTLKPLTVATLRET